MMDGGINYENQYKKISIILGLLLSIYAWASGNSHTSIQSYLEKEGLPLPDEGAKLVDKINTDTTPEHIKNQLMEMKQKGYYTSNSGRPAELLKMNQHIKGVFANGTNSE